MRYRIRSNSTPLGFASAARMTRKYFCRACMSVDCVPPVLTVWVVFCLLNQFVSVIFFPVAACIRHHGVLQRVGVVRPLAAHLQSSRSLRWSSESEPRPSTPPLSLSLSVPLHFFLSLPQLLLHSLLVLTSSPNFTADHLKKTDERKRKRSVVGELKSGPLPVETAECPEH